MYWIFHHLPGRCLPFYNPTRLVLLTLHNLISRERSHESLARFCPVQCTVGVWNRSILLHIRCRYSDPIPLVPPWGPDVSSTGRYQAVSAGAALFHWFCSIFWLARGFYHVSLVKRESIGIVRNFVQLSFPKEQRSSRRAEDKLSLKKINISIILGW